MRFAFDSDDRIDQIGEGGISSGPSFALTYLAEGAANVVFTMTYEDKTNTERTVLRVRKQLDIPGAEPDKLVHFITDTVRPLFAADGITVAPVALRAINLTNTAVTTLNADLLARESAGTRPPFRHGTLIAPNERAAVIMENPIPASYFAFEIKPKWLAQSPYAPPGATRCRTCALRFKRGHDAGKPPKAGWLCPLGVLAQDNSAHATLLADQMVDNHARNAAMREAGRVDAVKGALVRFFATEAAGGRFFRHLAGIQQRLDPKVEGRSGVEDLEVRMGPAASEDLWLAMTLRDCSLMLAVPADQDGGEIIAKLADLDPKPAGKLTEWFEKEKSLLDGGFYFAPQSDDPRAPDACYVTSHET